MSSQQADEPVVVVLRTTHPGIYELRCRRCDLGLHVRLETQNVTHYELVAAAFFEEHAHDDDGPSTTLHLS